MKVAFVFPGEGSQYAGMGREISRKFPVARAAFDEADAALDFPISRLCFEGPEEDLKLTENTQPAILTTSTAVFRVLEEKGVRPDFVAGHSLGEYSALVAAGALKLGDAARLVHRRGRYMQEAVPVGAGAMAALLGLETAAVASVCERAAQGQVVSPANLNSPGQVVIAGNREAVERSVALLNRNSLQGRYELVGFAPRDANLISLAARRSVAPQFRVEHTNVINAHVRHLCNQVKARGRRNLHYVITERSVGANAVEAVLLRILRNQHGR